MRIPMNLKLFEKPYLGDNTSGVAYYNINGWGISQPDESILNIASETIGVAKDKIDNPSNLINAFYFCLLYDSSKTFVWDNEIVSYIPGHFYDESNYMPGMKCDVMLIGEAPSYVEEQEGFNFRGDYGILIFNTLKDVSPKDINFDKWYLTNVIKIPRYRKDRQNLLIKLFKPLLDIEIRLLEPKHIICAGNTAKKLFTKIPLAQLSRQATTYTYSTINGDMKCSVFAIPLTALHENRDYLDFKRALTVWSRYVYFNYERPKEDVEYEVITIAKRLDEIIETILKDRTKSIIRVAMDLEWNGAVPTDKNGYVRIISFSDTPDKTYIVKVSDTDGQYVFDSDKKILAELFNKLILNKNVQIVGHNFYSDIPWLKSLGIEIDKKWWFPKSKSEITFKDYPGIFDTIIAHHAYDESGDFDLEVSSEIYLNVSKWSEQLENFKKEYVRKHNISKRQFPGYGVVPDDILFKYAAKDVSYDLRLFEIHSKNLYGRPKGCNDELCYWIPYWINMRSLMGFIEMYETGILVDKKKLYKLIDIYSRKAYKSLEEFKEMISWPEYNLRSSQQTVALLFGEDYLINNKKILPPNVKSFGLTPIKTTTTFGGIPWKPEFKGRSSPSTDAETCQVLAAEHIGVEKLRNIKLLDQVIKTVLRPPEEEEGEEDIQGGLLFYIRDDGRIHPTYFPLRETRRCSSKNPNVQNLAKSKEEEYKHLLGEQYEPIRSVLIADEGYKLIEIDLTAAELLMMGIMAHEYNLIEDYYKGASSDFDIHSKIATVAFGLDCPPTKKGLEEIGKLYLRNASKRIIFGLNYGMGKNTFKLQLEKQNIKLSTEEIEAILNTIYNTYWRIPEYHEQIENRVKNEKWICNCFGSFRHFPLTRNEEIINEKIREALNYPCQSGVADSMSLIMYNLCTHPLKQKLDYKLLLHTHDSLTILAKENVIDEFLNTVVPDCFQKNLRILPYDIDGIIRHKDTYTFAYEVKIGEHL